MSRQTYVDFTERFSEAQMDRLEECRENHEHGCPCLAGGDPIPRTVVIEANEGWEVVADLAPDERAKGAA
jgi:hypothetical protein